MVAPSPLLQPVRPTTLRLDFAPDALSARAVATAIRGFLAEQGVPESELFSYELCIAEAANNAIEYAVGPACGLKPVAEALFTPDQIELRMTDHTPGFALPERVPQPSPLRDCGRGLFIIQSAMDEVRYLRGTRENILIMRKRRRASQPAPALRESDRTATISLEESQRQLTESKSARATMAGELTFRSETLSAIFRCCSELGHSGDLAAGFGDRLLVDLLHLTCADWCVLRVVSPETRLLAVVAASEPGLLFTPLAFAAGPAPLSIEGAVAATQTALRFNLRELSDGVEPLRAVGPEATGLVCPLCFDGTLVGTIAVGRRGGDFPLGRMQDEVVRAFAEFLAIQTVNLRRHKEEVRNRVLARELEIAREIQLLLLPRTLPQPTGFGLAGGWQSAREVGGDFYDAIHLGGQSLLLLIADVMGKGVPAALFSTTMRGLLRGLAARSSDPAQLLSGLNRLLYAELSAVDMFITAQIVHVDLQTRQVTAACAGHCPLLFVAAGTSTLRALPSRGLPLGVRPDTLYHQETAILGDPVTVFLHTDGLTDTCNAAGERFGQKRLMDWLQANIGSGYSAGELRDRLATELNRFRGDAVMADDQAFLVMTEEQLSPIDTDKTAWRRPQTLHGSFLFPARG